MEPTEPRASEVRVPGRAVTREPVLVAAHGIHKGVRLVAAIRQALTHVHVEAGWPIPAGARKPDDNRIPASPKG